MEAGTGLRQPWPTRRGQAHTKVPREGLDWGGLSHTGCPEGLSRGLGQLSDGFNDSLSLVKLKSSWDIAWQDEY